MWCFVLFFYQFLLSPHPCNLWLLGLGHLYFLLKKSIRYLQKRPICFTDTHIIAFMPLLMTATQILLGHMNIALYSQPEKSKNNRSFLFYYPHYSLVFSLSSIKIIEGTSIEKNEIILKIASPS